MAKKTSEPTPLSDKEIAGRLRIGRNFCKRFARNDRQASAKFRDASFDLETLLGDDELGEADGGDVPDDVPVGQSNQLTTNIITKVASIAIGDPDWHVTTGQMENAAIVREFLQEKWRLSGWVRLSWKVLLKRYVSGLGILAYRWDDENRSEFEFVNSWDFCLDPHTKDFSKIRWAARRIKLPVEEAVERYGAAALKRDAKDTDEESNTKPVEIWLYYDKNEECHVFEDTVIERSPNLYRRVPFLFLEGDIDPGKSIWPLGDFDLAAGLQAELSDVNLIISNRAKHGGPINCVDAKALGPSGMEALESGKEQQYIPCEDVLDPPIRRIPGEELSPTLLAVKHEMQQAMDGITGVTQYQRGVISESAKFATEVAAVSSQSGSRGTLASKEFERFLNRWAEIILLLEIAFGGAKNDETGQRVTTDEEHILWEAFGDVQEVKVVEASTQYKDPMSEQQSAMQLFNLMAQTLPLFAQIGGPIPNLKTFADDVLRAFGRHETDRFWTMPPAPPPVPGQPQPGMPPGAAPPGAAPPQPQPIGQ